MSNNVAPRGARWLASFIVAASIAVACDEMPTEPQGRDTPRTGVPASFHHNDSPRPDAPGTFRITITPSRSNISIGPLPLGAYAETLLVKLTTKSAVRQYWSDELTDTTWRGRFIKPWNPSEASSSTYGCWNYPYIMSAFAATKMSHCPRTSPTDTMMTMIKVFTMHGALTAHWQGKSFNSSGYSCDVPGAPPCFKYSGSYDITLAPTFSRLLLTASSDSVAAGDSVTFTTSTSSAHWYPHSVRQWIWVPDDSSAAVHPCGTAKLCVFVVPSSGVMYVRAKVDGRVEQQHAPVEAPQRFEIRADKQQARLGDSVTFTAYVDDSLRPIPRWRWGSSSVDAPCDGSSTCTRILSEVGTRSMVGYLTPRDTAYAQVTVPVPTVQLSASKAAVTAGEIVTFSLLVDGALTAADAWTFAPDDTLSEHTAACEAGVAVCEKVMRASGTMTASSIIAGADYQASKYVTVSGDCGAVPNPTTGASFDVVGQPCGESGSGTPKVVRLTVIKVGGVVPGTGNAVPLPPAADTIGVFAFDSSASPIHYSFTAASGFTNLLLFIDDTLRSESGSLTMDRDRIFILDARPTFEDRVQAHDYGTRLRNVVTSSDPALAYAAFAQWLMSETNARGAQAVSDDMALGAALKFSYPTDIDILEAFDNALAGTVFYYERSSSNVVVRAGRLDMALPWDTVPPELTAFRGEAPALPSIQQGSRRGRVIFVNGVRTTADDAAHGMSLLLGLVDMSPISDSVEVQHIWSPDGSSQWRALRDTVKLSCAKTVAAWGGLVSNRQTGHIMHQCGPFVPAAQVVATRLEQVDLVEAWVQYRALLKRDTLAHPGVVAAVRRQMLAQRDSSLYSIWVPHSQGNLVVAHALRSLYAFAPVESVGSCTAALPIAMMLKKNAYRLDGRRMQGFTTSWDILRTVFSPDFENRETNITKKADSDLSVLLPVIGPLQGFRWGVKAHSTLNYFVDGMGQQEVLQRLTSLYDSCRAGL